jgi:hypothetical protein
MHHGVELARIQRTYPDDVVYAPGFNTKQDLSRGDPYAVGECTDAWGCVITNVQPGVIGQVKHPIVTGEEWEDADNAHIPVEWLSIDKDKVNRFCKETDRFVIAQVFPRPFEQLQFVRGSENLYMDLILRPKGLYAFIGKMHAFYCELLETWARTDVDGIFFMDDWGAQRSLLINPKTWAEVFKPLYQDYIGIAHRHGKRAFMHSDGFILDIYPHLIDIGLDAINSQVFCMTPEALAAFKGKITFWGEMDRQHLLPHGTPTDISTAVKRVKECLWQDGGCIAQCEFGAGAKPENVLEVFRSWDRETMR